VASTLLMVSRKASSLISLSVGHDERDSLALDTRKAIGHLDVAQQVGCVVAGRELDLEDAVASNACCKTGHALLAGASDTDQERIALGCSDEARVTNK
jgi:hypothetical protein